MREVRREGGRERASVGEGGVGSTEDRVKESHTMMRGELPQKRKPHRPQSPASMAQLATQLVTQLAIQFASQLAA